VSNSRRLPPGNSTSTCGLSVSGIARARLSHTIHLLRGAATGLGVPSGGGVIVHADTSIEPLRRHAQEFRFESTRVTHSLLCAAEGD
jgi:cyanophycinase